MELKDYILPLRRWWWLIVASTLIATLASFAATRGQLPIYSARATLMVGQAIQDPNPNGSDIYLTQQLASTYTDIARRQPVRDGTMARLGLTWLPAYTVRSVPDTQLIEISVVDNDAQRAQAVANELADQVIRQAPASAAGGAGERQTFINSQLDDLETKITQTRDEVTKKQAELANMFSARQISDTQTQIAALQQKLLTLQGNYAALLANTQRGAINSLTVIEPATLPSAPIGPNRRLTILLAATIGLILAAGAAYLLEYMDDTLKSPDDVQKILALTTLGTVPYAAEVSPSNQLIVQSNSQSLVTEAYRVLRTNLRFAAVDRPLRTLLITSPAPGEGKSLTASNLAAALAQNGRRVILVDADLHRPRLHRVFNLRNNVGVTSALLESHPSLEGLLQETSVPGLSVLSSGPLPPNAAELLGSERMRELLVALTAIVDIVVLDSPPTTALSDASILATQTDGVLLVLDSGKTRRELAKRGAAALRQVKAHVLGVVLNRVPLRGDRLLL